MQDPVKSQIHTTLQGETAHYDIFLLCQECH